MLVYLNIIARVSTCFVEYRMGKELPMGPIIEPTDAFYLKSNMIYLVGWISKFFALARHRDYFCILKIKA